MYNFCLLDNHSIFALFPGRASISPCHCPCFYVYFSPSVAFSLCLSLLLSACLLLSLFISLSVSNIHFVSFSHSLPLLGVVPILIVSTTGDSILNSNLTGRSTPILNRESLHSIADFHGVDTKHIVILDSESRAPMLSVETAGAFNKIVYDWIDDL